MKFDKVTLAGSKEITLFDLNNPRSSPYAARTIDGLGPTDLDVTLAQTTQGNGLYVGRRKQLREITINAYLNPDYTNGETPEMLREDIYELRSNSYDDTLDFNLYHESQKVATTKVYLKRADMPIYSKDSVLQIVLASPSEYFDRPSPSAFIDPSFDKQFPVFHNPGTAPIGFTMKLLITQPTSSIILSDQNVTNMVIETLGNPFNFLQPGDILEINTTIGWRGVWRHRAGVRTNYLKHLTPDSGWLTLQPGVNNWNVQIGGDFEWKELVMWPKYKGV